MKIIIAGGGTGGHVFPAVSIAEEIIKRCNKTEVLFVGTRKGIEKKIITELGYNITLISSGGLIGKNFLQKIMGIISALKGIIKSISIIREFKPDVILGVGGYASGPTVLSGLLNLIPTAICEQNSVPGFTNRVLSKFVKKIFITFEESNNYFPRKKTVLTGNPIRNKLTQNDYQNKKINNEKYNLLILGGSQGATKLNETIPNSLKSINNKNLSIFHQTGEKDYESVVNSYKKLNIKAEVYKFIDDVSKIYSKTDLVICRAGAGTLSEITALGLPSILIPFPYATHNHQLFNAKILEKKNASIIIEEDELNESKLSDILNKILNEKTLKNLSINSRKLGRPKAAFDIVNHIETLIKKKKCTEK